MSEKVAPRHARTTRKIYPPAINVETERFWKAAEAGKLLYGFCLACSEPHYYPRSFCPFCFSERIEWRAAAPVCCSAARAWAGRPRRVASQQNVQAR